MGLRRCCASTFCSSGTGWPTRPWRTRSTTSPRCGSSRASTWAARPCPTRRPCWVSATCWSEHDLTKGIFAEVNALLEERGILLREGTIVDATIIAAPPSTKNKARERDPEMHQTRKGKQWYFGLKAHVGVDAASGAVHTVTATAANVADIAETHRLLHGKEERVLGDSGYTGVEKRPEIAEKFPGVAWQIAARRGGVKAMAEGPRKEMVKTLEKCKAQLRA